MQSSAEDAKGLIGPQNAEDGKRECHGSCLSWQRSGRYAKVVLIRDCKEMLRLEYGVLNMTKKCQKCKRCAGGSRKGGAEHRERGAEGGKGCDNDDKGVLMDCHGSAEDGSRVLNMAKEC